VLPLSAYEAYYKQRAQLWEIHALTRARGVTGPLQQQYVEMAQSIWRNVGEQSDLFDKIDNMLMRIRRDRSSGSDFLDFKTGAGGLIEAEFLVQALQMRAGIWAPNWREALNSLERQGSLSKEEATIAARSYELLRRCETALRRWEVKNVSVLPANPDEQEKLALRLGHESRDAFAKEFSDAREALHALYQARVQNATT
jgi:glutamate-ammonia-ligase adenylyltransferase